MDVVNYGLTITARRIQCDAVPPPLCDDQGTVKALLLTLTTLAAAIGMAVPARADDKDVAFLTSLQAAGITRRRGRRPLDG